MATVSAKVYEHHKKTDGTYNVKICVHHKSERKFIDTNHYVVKKQLTKDFKIKDPFVVEKVDRQLTEYHTILAACILTRCHYPLPPPATPLISGRIPCLSYKVRIRLSEFSKH